MMEMPKPGAEHKKLERFVGIWKGKETMYPSQWCPEQKIADGETRCRVALSGFGIVADYSQSVDGNETFNGHGIYTFDEQSNEVAMYWFDCMGSGCEQFRGGWETDDRLVLRSENPMMGHMRVTYDFHADGRMDSSMENSQDGDKWTTMFDSTYTNEA